jgi:hypothetical protein
MYALALGAAIVSFAWLAYQIEDARGKETPPVAAEPEAA